MIYCNTVLPGKNTITPGHTAVFAGGQNANHYYE
jgi:hypothetical protein